MTTVPTTPTTAVTPSSPALTLFQRAHRRLPLTPEERAILKFIYLSLGTAAVTGYTAVAQYLGSASHTIDWRTVFLVFFGAFSVSLVETGRKWVSANGDGPLGMALQLVTEATKRTNLVKQVSHQLGTSGATPTNGPSSGQPR